MKRMTKKKRVTHRHKPKGVPSVALRRTTRDQGDTSSIDAMERTATMEQDRDCSIKIGDHWLEVSYDPKPLKRSERFKYKWGKNYIERSGAVEVHKMKGNI